MSDQVVKSQAEIGKARFSSMRDLLETNKAQFARVLPSHMDADRLMRIALTQIRTNPKLLDCTPESMMGALMKAAQLGLEPDGVTGRAYLIPRWNSRLQTNEVTFQRGYKGILDLAYRSGQVASVRADVVHEGDFLEYEKGLNEKLVHRPGAQFNSAPTYVYAIITLKGGGALWDIWSYAKIEAHRLRFSKDTRSDSVWKTDWEAMAKKTLLIAVGNLAPMAIEWAHAAAEETTGEAVMDTGFDITPTNGEVVDQPPAPETNTDKLKKAARKTKTDSAVVAGAPESSGPPNTPPVSVTPEASPPPGPAATAAPSPAPKRTTQLDWLEETTLIKVWLGAVMELAPDVSSSLLKLHGGTRGHSDGCLGLKLDAEEQERLMIDLKEAGVRKRAGIA